MKKLMISIFAIAAMVSCTSENEIIDNGGKNDEKVEIKMKAGINAVTKAAIPNTLTSPLNIYFLRTDEAQNASITWGPSSTKIPAQIQTNLDITFYNEGWTTETPQYYHPDPSKYTHLAGIYLGENSAIPTIKDNGSIEINIDGTKDILATNISSANKEATSFTIEFNHMLSQLTFKLKTDGALADLQDLYGNIESISVLNQPNTLSLTFESNTPTITTTGAAKNEFELLLTDTGLENGVKEVTGSILVYADETVGTQDNPIKLSVKCAKLDNAIEVPVTLSNVGLESSKTHSIELTFSKKEISPKATIGPWTNSEHTGTGEI